MYLRWVLCVAALITPPQKPASRVPLQESHVVRTVPIVRLLLRRSMSAQPVGGEMMQCYKFLHVFKLAWLPALWVGDLVSR